MKENYGFTLIEVITAFALIFILLIVVFTVFPSLQKGLMLSENHATAALLGKNILDQARAIYFKDLKGYSGSQTFTGIKNGKSVSLKLDYTLYVNEIVSGRKKKVWVDVKWKDAVSSVQKKVTLETIIIYNP